MRASIPAWSDLSNIWATVRDVDVHAIREEAERPVSVACVGHETALEALRRLLVAGGEIAPSSAAALTLLPLNEAAGWAEQLRSASLLILAVSARRGITPAEAAAFGRMEALGTPYLVVLVGGSVLPPGAMLPPAVAARTFSIPDPTESPAVERLAAEVLLQLPEELHLSAARRLPGLRAVYARNLIGQVSFANAAYALASGLPEQVPVLNVPFAAADIFVLTKNQALLVYRLGLAHGAAPDFGARIREVAPVLGGAFLWRQLARSLVGLIPVWGLAPKIAVAYAGTYSTGVAAWRWYERGELVSREQLQRISTEALALGQARAAELVEQARSGGEGFLSGIREAGAQAAERVRAGGEGLLTGIRARLPRLEARQAPRLTLRERLPFRRRARTTSEDQQAPEDLE
jgi:uncharacterized protein (DUF697 family)